MAYSYAALQSELTADPLSRGYASMSDADAAASLNAINRAGPNIVVPPGAVIAYLALQGKYFALQCYASGKTAQGVTGAAAVAALTAANELLTLLTLPAFNGFDLSNAQVLSAVQGFLGALVADPASGILAADAAALLALGQTTISRAAEIGWPLGVGSNDVVAARGA